MDPGPVFRPLVSLSLYWKAKDRGDWGGNRVEEMDILVRTLVFAKGRKI